MTLARACGRLSSLQLGLYCPQGLLQPVEGVAACMRVLVGVQQQGQLHKEMTRGGACMEGITIMYFCVDCDECSTA